MVAPAPARPDSTVGDSVARRAAGDSAAARAPGDTARRLTAADTLKAPFARGELPPVADIGSSLRYDRPALFASGALTLADLLERIPGVTTFRGRWVTAPMTAAYLGEIGRVRVFVDGLELDALDVRMGGSPDLSAVQLWPMEDVAIERGASELRVYLRTWRHRRTTPYTRVDVATGDEDTNIYRGFYGKRFRHGEALQIAAQQLSTQVRRSNIGGDGNALSLLARVGIARGRWSVDGFVNRTRRDRSELQPVARADVVAVPPVAALDATDSYAYLRAGYGDPERGFWAQALAGSLLFSEVAGGGNLADPTGDDEQPASVGDTTRSRAQYVAALGFTAAGLRVSATNRVRVYDGLTEYSPSGRVAFERPRVALSLFAERSTLDSRTRTEALARVLPVPFFALSGAVSRTGAGQVVGASLDEGGELATLRAPAARAARGEASVRVGGLWVGGGVLARDSTILPPPVVFDRSYAAVVEGPATGTFANVQGRLYKDLYADMIGMRWNSGDSYYRPQLQSRARLYLATEWRSRFPSGNFGALLSAMHEYRSNAFFLVDDATLRAATQSRVLSTLVEIRIVNAVVSWQFRNILGDRYQTVPGFEMPRPTNVYGVRWEFWN